jgi:hypothetical protein
MTKSNNVVYDIVIKALKPTSDGVITTANRYPANLAVSRKNRAVMDVARAGKVMEVQTIVSVSDMAAARGFKVGQTVLVSFNRYGIPVQVKNTLKTSIEGEEDYNAKLKYEIPVVDINGVEHLKLLFSDIEYIVEDYEIVQA